MASSSAGYALRAELKGHVEDVSVEQYRRSSRRIRAEAAKLRPQHAHRAYVKILSTCSWPRALAGACLHLLRDWHRDCVSRQDSKALGGGWAHRLLVPKHAGKVPARSATQPKAQFARSTHAQSSVSTEQDLASACVAKARTITGRVHLCVPDSLFALQIGHSNYVTSLLYVAPGASKDYSEAAIVTGTHATRHLHHPAVLAHNSENAGLLVFGASVRASVLSVSLHTCRLTGLYFDGMGPSHRRSSGHSQGSRVPGHRTGSHSHWGHHIVICGQVRHTHTHTHTQSADRGLATPKRACARIRS